MDPDCSHRGAKVVAQHQRRLPIFMLYTCPDIQYAHAVLTATTMTFEAHVVPPNFRVPEVGIEMLHA